MHSLTVAGWFRENSPAKHALKRMMLARVGSRSIVTKLKMDYEYPFSDHYALMQFMRSAWPALYARHRAGNRASVAASKAPEKPKAESYVRTRWDLRQLEKRENFIVNSAVNNCEVDDDFLNALLHLADDRDAALCTLKLRYKNPQTKREAKSTQPDEWWDPKLRDFMLEDEIRPHPRLSLLPVKIQATQNNPLPPRITGLTQNRSAIIGHPQLMMRTVPTPQHKLPKTMYTSGAITKKSYSDTLSGEIAEFHHSLAAVLVEVRGDQFHLREITWCPKRKAFIDLADLYTARGREDAPPAEALIMGDIHVPLMDPLIQDATFNRADSLYNLVKPKRVGIHDLFDGRCVNPHEVGKTLTAALRASRGQLNVRREAAETAAWLNALPADPEVFIVRSNHDDFLLRWLERGRPEPENARVYHELCAAMLAEAEDHEKEFPNPLALLLNPLLTRDVRWLDFDESYSVKGVELGMHGHLGPNGARGGRNLAQIGTRFIAAHVHSPAIFQGGYWAGLSALYAHGYNKGPSSWLQAHVILNALGYRQMTTFVRGNYRGN